jgi:LysR family glycine cleavage system transcriptional activator
MKVPRGWRGWDGGLAVDVTPMLAPSLLGAHSLAVPAELVDFELLPHPDWEQWFIMAHGEIPSAIRFAAVDFPTHELNANAALAGGGVALLSPTLFGSLLAQGLLVAPFRHVLSGPAWHFALMRADDRRMAPRHFCAWLREQAGNPP